ncbi:MAG TPA: alpha-glucosidase C-terminal domain-containing protein, partial [Bacteroidota bacterium]|nr:alpha-glucosidase C-terminal domain-containing protein [Bacteroidota bacterium]
GEEYPINTGLDFTSQELQQLPSERLPLFSEYGYDWTRPSQITEFVANVVGLRCRYHSLVVDPRCETFRVLEQDNRVVTAYTRVPAAGGPRLAVIANGNCEGQESTNVRLGTTAASLTDLLTGKAVPVASGTLHVALKPGESVVVEY